MSDTVPVRKAALNEGNEALIRHAIHDAALGLITEEEALERVLDAAYRLHKDAR